MCSTVSTNQNGKGVAVKEAAQKKSRSTGNKISEHNNKYMTITITIIYDNCIQ